MPEFDESGRLLMPGESRFTTDFEPHTSRVGRDDDLVQRILVM
jgi:hypothetical protein